MGLPEFAEYLGVPVSDTLQDMFSLFDEVGRLPARALPHVLLCRNRSISGVEDVERERPPPSAPGHPGPLWSPVLLMHREVGVFADKQPCGLGF